MSEPDQQAARPEDWRKVRRLSVLDTSGEEPGTLFPTVYVSDELLVDPEIAPDALGQLQELAASVGWTVDPIGEDGEAQSGVSEDRSRSLRLRISVSKSELVVAPTPDAWALLRQAKKAGWGDAGGLSLNHVLTTDSIGVNPFKANPFKANPFKANPFKANPFKANAVTVGIESYAVPGFGGLQPVTYLGPEPAPRHPENPRPIVAIFDTGLGSHPWLDGVAVPARLAPNVSIGLDPDDPLRPELAPSVGEPLDGIFDDAAGHGTFIAGIVRQECPDALILPVRISDGDGLILESTLIAALERLVRFMADADLEAERGGAKVKVLNLSFSYYHETPDNPTTLSKVAKLLDDIRGSGCVVVCSAGNEATSRPTYPAAIPAQVRPELHVSVGALNPSDDSVALFSNVGDWVRVYAPGVSIVSTLPVGFEGGLQAGTRDDDFGYRRQTLDPDDFRGGFGVWSGTSFAAPVVAGRIADVLAAGKTLRDAEAAGETDPPAKAAAVAIADVVQGLRDRYDSPKG